MMSEQIFNDGRTRTFHQNETVGEGSVCNAERATGGSHANLPTKAKAQAGPPFSGARCAGRGSD